MSPQTEKGEAFAALHARAGAFIIPNPWDVGSACLLAHLGFEALATTSAGCAFSMGKPDGAVSRAETLRHLAAIAAATELPVSGDLENGFGESSETVADTIARAAQAGLVGGSIEDMASRGPGGIYELAHAVDRIRAAADAVRRLPFRFTLTARAENYRAGRPDLGDTITRLQAYQDAGADVLYAPGLRFQEEIETVVRAVDRPVNVLMGLQGVQLSAAELATIGVKRISIGSALARGAYGAALRAGREMRELGTFAFAQEAVSYREIDALFSGDPG